jgi:hypothetical protein
MKPSVLAMIKTPARMSLLVLALLPGISAASDSPKAATHLGPPDYVAPETRVELDARMARHGAVMSNLVRAVVLLDRPTIRLLAGRIADEEVISRSARSPHAPAPLSLPREFFIEQTKLAGAARDLAVAAADGADDRVLAERFAAVTGTCVGCHSSYLHGRPAPDLDDTNKTASGRKR